jgi:hypothetical protein
VSLTAARKICSPPATVNTSYTAQALMRLGMGAAGWPVTANCIMCCATRSTLFSNSALCTTWPRPVCGRAAAAPASAPMAPNMPPMMSLTLVPARSGRPSGPVM